MTRHHARYCIALTVLIAPPISAAPTFIVNNIFDVAAGGDLTNGVCETAPGNGVCTVRAAIMKANNYPGGGAAISIPSGTYTLSLLPQPPNGEGVGDLNVSRTMTLAGAGMNSTIIDAAGIDSAMKVVGAISVGISDLTIRNARNSTPGGTGGISNDGANLTLDRVRLTANQGAAGAGLHHSIGTVIIRDSLVDRNVNPAAGFDGGGLYIRAGTMTLERTAVTDNVAAARGGGIAARRSAANQPAAFLILNDSTVTGNLALVGGGILAGDGVDYSVTATLNRSTVNANYALDSGGGIAVQKGSTVTLNNSTISANSTDGSGGGILNLGNLSLFHVTMTGNVADAISILVGSGGALRNAGGTVSLTNSLLADTNYVGQVRQNCDGASPVSHDYNYRPTCFATGTTTHDILFGPPLLGPLRNSGGATPTHALYTGSVAADKIPSGLCRDSFGMVPTTDQRNVQRPSNLTCDIGAYEGTVPLPLFNANLLGNGDADASGGSRTGSTILISDWTVISGSPTAVRYGSPGGFPTPGVDAVPAMRGYNFFSGGQSPFSHARQTIPVAAGAGAIDASTVKYRIAGDFGGFLTDNDSAELWVFFLDANGATLGAPVVIGGFNAAYRASKTGLFPASATGSVPVGTRSVQANLRITRTSGAFNDGYADNLSVVLTNATLDIDGNGAYDALTDGLLLIRYLFGLTGSALVNGAVGPGATRNTPADIIQFLDTIKPQLDVDGNLAFDALTDGLILLRYLFGLRGPALIASAIGPGATRTTDPAISAYIDSLLP